MKNFTKKRGLFAVAAVLLIVAAMLVTTGCGNDIGNELTIPEGKGAIKLNFNKETARTVLPGDDIDDIDDFDQFVFQFTSTDSTYTTSGTVISKTVAQGDQNDAIILDPGYYKVIVMAYIDFGGGDMREVAVNATAVNVQIIPAQTINATIALKPYSPTAGTGNGTFEYELIDSTGGVIEIANMNYYLISGTPLVTPIDIITHLGAGKKEISPLQAGYYYVVFEIKVESGDIVRFRQVVHISQNLTSSYTFDIHATYFYATFQLRDNNTDLIYEQLTDNGPAINYAITVVSPSSGTCGAGRITVKRGATITFTVSNPGDFADDSFKWYCLDTDAITTVTGSTTISANTVICTINTATAVLPNNPYSYAKDYDLTVEGKFKDDNKIYSTVIKFKVEP